MKRFMLVFLMLFASSWAQAAVWTVPTEATYVNKTGKFISFANIAKELGLPVADVIKLAPENRRTDGGLFRGERMLKVDLGLGPYTAIYHHQSEAVKDFIKVGPKRAIAWHLQGMRPAEAKLIKQFLDQQIKVEDRQLEFGELLISMAFGKDGKLAQLRNCVWWPINAKYQPIQRVPAHRWVGTDWAWVEACYNVTQLRPEVTPTPTEIPKKVVTTPPTPPPTVPPTEKPRPRATAIPTKTPKPSLNPSWGAGVLWLVPEYVRADQLTQFNFYGGIESRWALNHRWWWVFRAETGPGWNFPDEGEGIDTSAQTSSLRTGFRYRLIDKAPVALDFEAGVLGWYHSEHYAQFYWDGAPGYLEGDASKLSGGGYARLLGKGRYETYYELEYRNAGLESAFTGNLSTEPKRFYAEVGGGQSNYGELEDEGLVYRQDGTFTEWHAKAGYKVAVRRPLILAATYQSWRYESDIWEIDWSGPGLYLESRFDPRDHWRLKVHGIYFADREDGPPGEQKTKSHEERVQLTLTYAW